RARGQLRADVFDATRAVVYSSSGALRIEPLIGSGWVARALAEPRAVHGLAQASRERYYWVVAQRFGSGAQAGVLALGLDTSSLLPELAKALEGDSFLFNLRGR